MAGWKKFLRYIDVYGKEFKFNVGESQYTTLTGGIMTILSFSAICVLTYYFGNNIVFKDSPYFLKVEDFINEAPVLTNTQMNTRFAITVEDLNSAPVNDPKYFHFLYILSHFSYNKKSNKINLVNRTIVNAEKCGLKHFDNQTLTTESLDNYMCPPTFDFLFGGEWYKDIFVPSLLVKTCDKVTEKSYNITCATKEEYIKLTNKSNLYFSFKYLKNFVASKEFTNPIKSFIFYEYKDLDIYDQLNAQHSTIKYSTANITTDKGLIFEDKFDDYFPEIDIVTKETIKRTKDLLNGNFLGHLEIFLTRNYNTYERFYMKIPDLIANVGGFFSIFDIVLRYIWDLFLDNKFVIFLYKKLISFEVDDNEDQSQVKVELIDRPINNSIINISNANSFLYSGEIITNYKHSLSFSSNPYINPNKRQSIIQRKEEKGLSGLNKDLQDLIHFKNIKRRELHISESERFRFQFCYNCCFPKNAPKELIYKYELFNAAETYLEKFSNVINIFKMFEQQKVIRKIVLNKNQDFLLTNIEKKIITNTLAFRNRGLYGDLEEEKNKKSLIELTEYLRQYYKEVNKNKIDTILLSYADAGLVREINRRLEN